MEAVRVVDCSWKFAHYRECLVAARSLGYVFTTFRDFPQHEQADKLIILRHDIDFSVPRALEFAKIEKALGIKAAYFVRLHSPAYNPFEYKAYLILKKIQGMGHELGLHFEVFDFQAATGEDLVDIFRREKQVLENILGTPVVSAAQHGDYTRIGPDYSRHFFTQVEPEEMGIKYQTFDDRFFWEMKYISDSSGRWREGCMCRHIGRHRRLQILTHPCWWFHKHYHVE